MSIEPQALLPFIHKAFDGMVSIAEQLSDARINQRPDVPHTNSPYAILAHCVGVTQYWIGSVLGGRPNTRDRDAEFRAQGTVVEICQAVRTLQQQLQEDIRHVQGDQPLGYPVDLHGHLQEHTQGDILLHFYTELAQHHGQMELTRDVLLAK